METCPRCGRSLEELSLGDAKTMACNGCGYADIPVDHESKREKIESWRDALERFYTSER